MGLETFFTPLCSFHRKHFHSYTRACTFGCRCTRSLQHGWLLKVLNLPVVSIIQYMYFSYIRFPFVSFHSEVDIRSIYEYDMYVPRCIRPVWYIFNVSRYFRAFKVICSVHTGSWLQSPFIFSSGCP